MSGDPPAGAGASPRPHAPTREDGPSTIFLSAGEPSGDEHGARLAAELRRRRPGVRLVGLGGRRMAAEGVELLADLDTLAVLGFAEVLGRLPYLLRLRRRVRRFLSAEGVDLLVPIDYPGFNLPLARHAHRRGIRVLYYIVPQVWAWHASRARTLERNVDRVCAVLPFEPEFLARYGARAEFVGHPLLDAAAEEGARGEEGRREDGGPPARAAGAAPAGSPGEPERSGAARGRPGAEPGGAHEGPGRRAEGSPSDAAGGGPPVLSLFPGSRAQEVERMLPVFLAASERLRRELPGLRVLVARAPDLPEARYAAREPIRLVPPEVAIRLATAALAKSGTITLKLAVAGVPMVVGYRMNPVTWQVARRLVRVEHVALANLAAGERVVPELLQSRLTPERLAERAAPLLRPGDPLRDRMVAGLARARARLGGPGCTARVAERCLELLEAGAGRAGG